MFATLTSKGQLTLPKEIRDRLNLDAGAILDFQLQADNTITARHVQPDARRIRGGRRQAQAAGVRVHRNLRSRHAQAAGRQGALSCTGVGVRRAGGCRRGSGGAPAA